MLRTGVSLLFCLAAAAGAFASGLPLSHLDLKRLSIESMNDGIPSGWCGRAMLSLLKKSGLGDGLKPGNGQDWEQILAAAGWRPIAVSSPYRAPLGSVLVYLGDRRMGKTPRGTRGGYHGHVEMVSLAPQGGRLYVSDSARPRPGGTVVDNFTGRAWLPPRAFLAKAPPIADQVQTVLEERLKMATRHFERKSGDLAQLRVGKRRSRIDPACPPFLRKLPARKPLEQGNGWRLSTASSIPRSIAIHRLLASDFLTPPEKQQLRQMQGSGTKGRFEQEALGHPGAAWPFY